MTPSVVILELYLFLPNFLARLGGLYGTTIALYLDYSALGTLEDNAYDGGLLDLFFTSFNSEFELFDLVPYFDYDLFIFFLGFPETLKRLVSVGFLIGKISIPRRSSSSLIICLSLPSK